MRFRQWFWENRRAVAWVVVLGALGFLIQQNTNRIVDRDQERDERTAEFCEYAHQQQVDARKDAIQGFRELPKFAEFFNSTPERLQAAARQNLIRNLHRRHGNQRIPDHCPQHDWPEKVSPEFRRTGR